MEYKNLFEFYIENSLDESLDPGNAFYDMFRNASPGALKYLRRLCGKENTTSMIKVAEILLEIPFDKKLDSAKKRLRRKLRKESSQKRRRGQENERKKDRDAIARVHSFNESLDVSDSLNKAEKKANKRYGEQQPKLGLRNIMKKRIENPGKVNVKFNDRVNRIFSISRNISDSERTNNDIFQTIANLFKSLGICKKNKSNYTRRDIYRIIRNR